jgi:hypothetical protein
MGNFVVFEEMLGSEEGFCCFMEWSLGRKGHGHKKFFFC